MSSYYMDMANWTKTTINLCKATLDSEIFTFETCCHVEIKQPQTIIVNVLSYWKSKYQS